MIYRESNVENNKRASGILHIFLTNKNNLTQDMVVKSQFLPATCGRSNGKMISAVCNFYFVIAFFYHRSHETEQNQTKTT